MTDSVMNPVRKLVDEAPKAVTWPAAVLREPVYPELEVKDVDLACDAMVFKPAFDPNDF